MTQNKYRDSISTVTMGSTAEDVRRCIEEDLFLQVVLARGIVGYRKMARWLSENHGVPGTESTIAQAIQRNEPENEPEAMAEAWASLQASRTDHRGNLATVRLPLTRETVDRLPQMLEEAGLERGGTFRLHHDESSITLVVDEGCLPDVEDELDDPASAEVSRGLSELRLVPPEGQRLHLLAASLAVAGLEANGHEVVHTISGTRSASIFIDEEDSRAAFELLEKITG